MTDLKHPPLRNERFIDDFTQPKSSYFPEDLLISPHFSAFKKLPFELQILQDLKSNRVFILKGSNVLGGITRETVDSFHKRILKEDFCPLIKVENMLLERLNEVDPCAYKDISLNATFRMFFASGDLRTVTRNSFIHETDSDCRPITIYHLFKDITGRVSDDHVRFKLNSPGEDIHKGFRKLNAISFTQREDQVLELLVQGFTSDEIASKLFIAPETVNKHRKNMIKKACVSDTRKLVALYLESKVL